MKRAPKKFIVMVMLATGVGGFRTMNAVFDQLFLKIEISQKKGIFDVNIVFTATLACTKSAHFITKNGPFGPLTPPPPPRGSYVPV
jgi:hypothetical protein